MDRIQTKKIKPHMKKSCSCVKSPEENVSSSGALVTLQDVTKVYDHVKVIDGLNLQVAQGEFLSIIGPSGCGKSTTLRMIGGFLKPTSGTILLKGEDVTGLDPSKHDSCMVFQDYALFPHMTVLQNVAFGLKMAGVSKKERAERAKEALALVGLADFGQRKPSQLSGGQRQRVALARAIVMRPTVLLLDEPLGALDAQIRRQMQMELKNLQRKLNHTFIYVTHDQEEAMTMSDRILLMRAGVVQQIGTPSELYDSPCSLFTAKFLGDCSVIEGEYDGESVTVRALGKIRGRCTAKPFTGRAAVCIRPEKLSICREAEAAAGEYCYKATVKSVIYKGLNTRVLLDSCGQEFVCEVAGHAQCCEGQTVQISFAGQDAVIVPYESIDINALVSLEDSNEKQ